MRATPVWYQNGRLILITAWCAGMASACGDSPIAPTTPATVATTPTLTAIFVEESTVTPGTTLQGVVTLDTAAPAGGFTVALSTDRADAASVPASVTVPAHATHGAFVVTADSVTVATSVKITATAGEVARTTTLKITPAEGVGPLASIAATHDDVIGGNDTTATVTLVAAAPAGGFGFALESDDEDVTVPDSLLILAGQTTGTFAIDTAPVQAARTAHITATAVTASAASNAPRVQPVEAATLTLSLLVLPEPNVPTNPPVAARDAYTTDEDIALVIVAGAGVLANDTDADNDALTVTLVSGPSNGALALNADGSFIYAPNTNFNGSDSFTYRPTGGGADGNIATVSLTIDAVIDERIFEHTGLAQTFAVPEGVTSVSIEAYGAQGGRGGGLTASAGGQGGQVTATLAVTTGETLAIMVGGAGSDAGFAGAICSGAAVPSVGGFNGGAAGSGSVAACTGGGGGGASDVRRGLALADRIIVAGGGGGGGGAVMGVGAGAAGGAGGGLAGADGGDSGPLSGGKGGNQAPIGPIGSTGPGVEPGDAGTAGTGGDGGDGTSSGGGGGGGGYYGGAGGAGSSITDPGAGGGGGSSFTGSGVTNVSHTQGGRSGHGRVIIRW